MTCNYGIEWSRSQLHLVRQCLLLLIWIMRFFGFHQFEISVVGEADQPASTSDDSRGTKDGYTNGQMMSIGQNSNRRMSFSLNHCTCLPCMYVVHSPPKKKSMWYINFQGFINYTYTTLFCGLYKWQCWCGGWWISAHLLKSSPHIIKLHFHVNL